MGDGRNLKASLLVMGSAVLYGICPTMIKWTYAYGTNGLLSTFYICLFALPFLFGWTRCAHISLRVDRRTLGKLLLLALGSSATSLMLYSSFAFIPVGMSTTLHFVYPVMVAAYLFLFFGQRLGGLRLGALALTAAGILCQSLQSLTGGNLLGIVLAVLSGMTWAFYMVFMEKSGLHTLHASVLNFYMALANAVCAGLACLVTHQFASLSGVRVWLVLALIAFLQRVAANAMFQVGLRGTGSFLAGIFSTFELVASVFAGVVALHERFLPTQILGMALILAGIAINTWAGAAERRRGAVARR